MSIPPVRKQIVVDASPEHTFRVFVDGAWWPKEHSILASGSPRRELVIERRVGGRWYEIGEDGSQCDWGRVLTWEPPRRLVLGWQINGRFEYDPSGTTEVDVHFVPEGDKTRVDFEHRGFDAYPESGQQLRDAVDGGNGWGDLLKQMARRAEASVASVSTASR